MLDFFENIDVNMLQAVVSGILALLIPVGIVVLQLYIKEGIEYKVELLTLLNRVVFAKILVVFSVGILFLFSLTDSFETIFEDFKILVFSIFLLYLFFITIIFYNIWKWFTDEKEFFIIRFLSSLNPDKNQKWIEDFYRDLWSKKYMTPYIENKYMEIFISHINFLLEEDDYRSYNLAVVISKFYMDNIVKRDQILVGAHLFPKLVEWIKFEMRFAEDESFQRETVPYRMFFYKTYFFNAVFHLLIYEYSYLFTFGYIYDYLKNESDKKIIELFFDKFFKFLNKKEKIDKETFKVINGYPENWIISKDNINNLHQKIIFRKFLNFFITRKQDISWDFILDKIISKLFSVDVYIFANSLMLIKYRDPVVFIKHQRNFGLDYRNSLGSEVKQIETIKLMKKSFLNFYNNKSFLEELKNKFENVNFSNINEERRKNDALKIIDDFLKTFK